MPPIWPSLRFPKPPCSLFLGTRELKNEQQKPRETVKVMHRSRYVQPHTKEKSVLDILIACLSCHFLFSALDKHKWCSNKHTELLHRSFPALPLWPQHFSLSAPFIALRFITSHICNMPSFSSPPCSACPKSNPKFWKHFSPSVDHFPLLF